MVSILMWYGHGGQGEVKSQPKGDQRFQVDVSLYCQQKLYQTEEEGLVVDLHTLTQIIQTKAQIWTNNWIFIDQSWLEFDIDKTSEAQDIVGRESIAQYIISLVNMYVQYVKYTVHLLQVQAIGIVAGFEHGHFQPTQTILSPFAQN